jgi:hypothetical protein
MTAPAVMIKLTEPAGNLYTILAISDEDIQKANNSFISKDAPYRIRRTSTETSAL